MTKLATLIELGHQHAQALDRARGQSLADDRIEHRRSAARELQDAVAGHLMSLVDIKGLLLALGGMLMRHADRAVQTADAEGELAAADELLSEAIVGIATAIEHEAQAEAALEERQAAFVGGYDAYFREPEAA